MHAALRCPVHGCALRQNEADELVCAEGTCRYPIVDGVAVLTDHAPDNAAATFYNDPQLLDGYLLQDQPHDRAALSALQSQIEIDGPTLEIGTGRGALQGIGGSYVAVDYSLTALRQWIKAVHQRVCASAERLPFFDNTFRLIFSVACLEHVPNASAAFDEIDRVLKPGGMAYLAPAWHCVQYNCDGVPVRPYRDLSLRNKFVKATLPLRRSRIFKAAASVPRRIARRLQWRFSGSHPAQFRFTRLRPDYKTFWLSDSDACSRLDSHEACLFFRSRGYQIIRPGNGTLRQLLAGHDAVVVQKPR